MSSVNSLQTASDLCGDPIYTYGNKKKIYSCFEDIIIRKNNNVDMPARAMQNFSITNRYIYFCTLYDYDNTISGTSRTYIIRKDRISGKTDQMYVNYAGHSQSFDVVQNGTYGTDGKTITDQIFMNGFSYDKDLDGVFRWVYYMTFGNGRKYPGSSIAIEKNKDKLSFEKINSKNAVYYKNGKFDSKTYYKDIKK